MNRTLASLLLVVLGAALWLLWNFEHEHTRIRAPWTGLTQVASACSFVAAGVVGRGWRVVAGAAVVAAAAVLLVEPLVSRSEPPLEPGYVSSCDPGCISGPPLYVLAGIVAAALTVVGILLRRTARALRARRRPAAGG